MSLDTIQKQKVLFIVGPTASGKTALSLEIAKRVGGEIISADSMQIYRGMDIGTAKPSESERQGIAHHMLDICSPCEEYSAACYARDAAEIIQQIASAGHLPIVVGGTGFYADALARGGDFAAAPPKNSEIRRELEKLCQTERGMEIATKRLLEIDPDSARRIHKNDKKRIIRALEVFEITGKTITEHNIQTKLNQAPYNDIWIAIAPKDRDILNERINKRVDEMDKMGLEHEAFEILNMPGLSKTAAQAIGYKEFADYFHGKAGKLETLDLIKLRTRQYAKRQMTWFRKNKKIFWIFFDKDDKISDISEISTEYIKRCGVL